jgi:2,3-bisphosphoglycerate-dependent phosphoglycerate mutase
MGDRGMKFDVAFTSNLERAWKTCQIALSAAGQKKVETIRSWKLNERHYGALQGHSKDSKHLIELFGEEKVFEWRRSYASAPPSLYDRDFLNHLGLQSLRESTSLMDERYLDVKEISTIISDYKATGTTKSYFESKIKAKISNINPNGIEEQYPSTESLKECEDRAFGYWTEVIAPRVKAGQRVLIVAHANTIRALVKAVDKIDDKMIAHLKIPNGIPLVYTLDKNLEPLVDFDRSDDLGFNADYLVSARNHKKVRVKGYALISLVTSGDGVSMCGMCEWGVEAGVMIELYSVLPKLTVSPVHTNASDIFIYNANTSNTH